MARRPVFTPKPDTTLVGEQSITFEWHPGFAIAQKRRSVASLHAAAFDQLGVAPLLEVSTKSPLALGVRLSAFHLRVRIESLDVVVPLEAAFQGSKVFAGSGQQSDVYLAGSGQEAKRLVRHLADEPLIEFQFDGRSWPLEPTTAFYDWLYLQALVDLEAQRPGLRDEVSAFAGFTDIEFNPKKSLNCQARSCALYVALGSFEDMPALVDDPDRFIAALALHGYGDSRPQL